MAEGGRERIMPRILDNRRGAVLLTFGLLLLVLLGFTALGVEVGRWYLVRSELSKGVDAAALAGARNISNPNVLVGTLVKELGKENFPIGYEGTPSGGEGAVSFDSQVIDNKKVGVTGNVSIFALLTSLFGVEQVATSGSAVAERNDVEIMFDLDRSWSMNGKPMVDLKKAAKGFLEFFKETEDQDKLGLVSFATGVRVDYRLSTNFYAGMAQKIDALSAEPLAKRQFTNAEDSIARCGDAAAGGFTDQGGIPGDKRVKQFLIFFTDGNPNAFRGKFTYQGRDYDAVAYVFDGNSQICAPDGNLSDPITGDSIGVPALPTGDGKVQAASSCLVANTKWHVFLDYPVPGYSNPDACNIPLNSLRQVWFPNVARQMAINQAQALKNRYITIFIIGLGGVDKNFLGQIASGPEYEYYAPTSDDLEAIFKKIAKVIKLRLVA